MKILFTNHWDLKETLVFESVYPKSLQMDLEEKQELINSGAEFIFMYDEDSGKVFGETYFIKVSKLEEDIEGANKERYGNSIYVYSTTILPKYQGRGYGKVLKAYFYGIMNERKIKSIIGHAKEGASVELNKLFGAKIVGEFHDWYGTGKTHYMYERVYSE